ncbi:MULTISPECIES: haloacid dehalogenase-like hydrolase [unclassified Pseudomonas]|uniref:haloacid dehalogenase-like hydrolase n=1 Tax=unclassified Pseudomonas TaxID=196821 RepID=UPI00128B2709|nr:MULTISPECIES: haloacid dehalogenase-like hydrolase [unclassified Pseudomonas]MPQ67273.1 haloacid dehalogenase-like hydrolase [Pseudomonas sp. MWU12-2323]
MTTDNFVLPAQPAGWSAANRRAINQLLQTWGCRSADYNPAKRPYAVFDWDNTCIMNDTEESLLLYQAENLLFKLTPSEFAEVLCQDVPGGWFHADYTNLDGQRISMEDLAADINDAYQWLYTHCAVLAGSQPLEEIRASAQFQNFRAKFYFLYGALCDTYPMEVGYKWIIYFYKNFTTAELQAMVSDSIEHNLGEALRQAPIHSSTEMPGRAGRVAPVHFHGMRVHAEIVALMATLRTNGFDVYISTASIDDVVRVFACDPKYGYGLPPENVLGLKLEMVDGKYTNVYKKDWHFNWGPGKTVGIQNVFVAQKGYGPTLVFGDSDGDAWMMKDFADTRLGVIINRQQKGLIGENSQQAAATLGRSDARFVLQGRDEHTGCFNADEKTLRYGHTEARLLA